MTNYSLFLSNFDRHLLKSKLCFDLHVPLQIYNPQYSNHALLGQSFVHAQNVTTTFSISYYFPRNYDKWSETFFVKIVIHNYVNQNIN